VPDTSKNPTSFIMNTRPLVGIAAVIIRNKKVLLGKRKGSHGTGTWGFPGGHLEYGESFIDCVKREVMEETSLAVANTQYAAISNDIYTQEEKHYVTIFMVCDYISGEAQVMEPEKCEQWEWFDWTKLPQPLFLSIQNVRQQGFNPFV
jgi:8-oxo-dGTP diphosphatase